MSRHVWRWSAVVAAAAVVAMGSARKAQAQPTFTKPAVYQPTETERRELQERLDALAQAMARLPRAEPAQREIYADVAVYHKAGAWTLRHGEFFNKRDVATTARVLDRGLERAKQLADGRHPWTDAAGSLVRAYVSKVDGSIQPYAVIVPPDLDRNRADDRRARLDVVLHGRGATLTEVSFINAHDGKKPPTATDAQAKADAPPTIILDVFGRTNNAYRWAGETDVFEAIEAVKRNYPIDQRRIVLRGFSMGGAGAWHLGLQHPSLWSSVEAGAGFTESKNYAKLQDIPVYQNQALHIYDAADYAGNAFDVPMAGYGGENDPQRQGSVNIEEALKTLGYTFKTEGLITRGVDIDFLRVVGEKMGHAVDPASAKILKAFHDEHAVAGAALNPRRIRLTTYTLKYSQAAWLSIEQLDEHYRRALVEAELEDGRAVITKIENVAVLGVERHVAPTIRLGGDEFALEGAVKGLLPYVYFRRVGERWEQLDYDTSRAFQENAERGKRRNLQGPIDDAFMSSFLCVRGTGKAWNPVVQQWADGRLAQFQSDWHRWMRGAIRIKDDTAVTAQDIEEHNLILFGDPGSNRVLARVLKGLPLGWTESEVSLAGTFRAADHAPVLVALNPLNPHRYVVVNSGHTFGATEFRGTNALLFPHLGDYAVIHVDRQGGEPKVSGFFNERWALERAPAVK